jgi:hypothetical protein
VNHNFRAVSVVDVDKVLIGEIIFFWLDRLEPALVYLRPNLAAIE